MDIGPGGPGDHGEARIGSVIGGYRIETVLGHGGMGVVYRATQLTLDRPVAIASQSARRWCQRRTGGRSQPGQWAPERHAGQLGHQVEF